MRAQAAIWGLYARRVDLWFLAVVLIGFGILCIGTAQYLAVMLEPSEHDGLILLGLSTATMWLPVFVGATLRSALADARERMVPSLAPLVSVAISLLLIGSVPCMLTAVLLLHVDATTSLALVMLVECCLWKAGWYQGRSLVLLVLFSAMAVPATGAWIHTCLRGQHPLGACLLLAGGAVALAEMIASAIADVRADRCRERVQALSWAPWFERVLTPTRLRAWTPVGARRSSMVSHLSRGWRAEIAPPLGWFLLALAAATALRLVWSHHPLFSAEISLGAQIGCCITLMQWIANSVAVDSGPLARADAMRSGSRAEFALLVLLVGSRSLVRSWSGLWAGCLVAVCICGGIHTALATLPYCLLSAGLLPAVLANFAWILSIRRESLLWVVAATGGVLAVAAMPIGLLVVNRVGLGGIVLATIGCAGAGVAASWISYRRLRTIDLG